MEWDCICDDVREEILSRLPIRDLLRLKCVSKSWCALIESYKFINKRHQMQYAISIEDGDIPMFLNNLPGDSPEYYLLSKKRGDNIMCLTPDLDRDSATSFTDDRSQFSQIYCAGVVNGVVGLYWRRLRLRDEQFGFWNPATREFKVVVPSRRRKLPYGVWEIHDSCGLGFDPKSNNFKIVRFKYWFCAATRHMVGDILNGPYKYEMYSLGTNTWKSLTEPLRDLKVETYGTNLYFNGVCYWTVVQRSSENVDFHRYLILSFDFITDTFKLLDSPPCSVMTKKKDDWGWKVGQYMEQLAVIFTDINRIEGVRHFEVWVVSKFDNDNNRTPLSWQHLLTIGPITASSLSLIAIRMDGDFLLTTDRRRNRDIPGSNDQSKLYNPSTGKYKKLGLTFDYCCYCFRYVESLFPLSKRQVDRSPRGPAPSSRRSTRKRRLPKT